MEDICKGTVFLSLPMSILTISHCLVCNILACLHRLHRTSLNKREVPDLRLVIKGVAFTDSLMLLISAQTRMYES